MTPPRDITPPLPPLPPAPPPAARASDTLRVLCIVPAYNEAASIGRVVCEIGEHAPDYDVLVVDDGSTDGTAAAVPAGTTVIRLPFNLGIGGAMQTGYRYALEHDYDIAVQIDGDGQHPAAELAALLAPVVAGDADLSCGSRFLARGDYRQTLARAAGSGLLSGLLRVLTGRRFTDCTSGFRAVNRRVIHAFAQWYPDDYPEPEVVLLLVRAGFRVTELPVAMRQRTGGRSSISLLHGVVYVAKVGAALLLDTMRHPWPAASLTTATHAATANPVPAPAIRAAEPVRSAA